MLLKIALAYHHYIFNLTNYTITVFEEKFYIVIQMWSYFLDFPQFGFVLFFIYYPSCIHYVACYQFHVLLKF